MNLPAGMHGTVRACRSCFRRVPHVLGQMRVLTPCAWWAMRRIIQKHLANIKKYMGQPVPGCSPTAAAS